MLALICTTMPKEMQTDIIVANLLTQAGIHFDAHESRIYEIKNALLTASKKGTGKQGFPEFVAKVGNFIIVVEDKADNQKQAHYLDKTVSDEKKTLLTDTNSIVNYAENGAFFYAQQIVQKTSFKQVFAFGCSGTNYDELKIRPIFVTPNDYKLLKTRKDFANFAPDKIDTYYQKEVIGCKTLEQIELESIMRRAATLHEDIRNYAPLRETEKPLLVSGILLALCDEDFDIEQLTGDDTENYTDGQKMFRAIQRYMDRVHVQPGIKKNIVLDSFNLIRDRIELSHFNDKLGKTPLRYFAEFLQSNVLSAIRNNVKEDVLGRFYGEFFSYSGGDGQTLGIILTPKHITELFCDLLQIKPNDKILDPCCGTAGFLIAAMNRMLEKARDNKQKEEIKRNQLFGIENEPSMYSIATTNMILRGDGKSNLHYDNFLNQNPEEWHKKGFSIGMMNPPYSLAKNQQTAHLSELHFIKQLLNCLDNGARAAVIVPQSAMVGKNKVDKAIKEYILQHHTLEGVITLNPQTFFGVGTNPVIAIFTAHQPHPQKKYAKFINFKDDGYEVFPQVGLLPTERAKKRNKLLIDCWCNGKQASNEFMITSQVEPQDEWLHSYFYFNDAIPDEQDFMNTMADYLTFEFNMITHGKEFLFENINN